MEINEYQAIVMNYADYPKEIGPFALALDLDKNAGILSGKLYDILVDKNDSINENERTKIAISLGDILYDIANMTSDLGLELEEVIALNLRKRQLIKEREIKAAEIAQENGNTK